MTQPMNPEPMFALAFDQREALHTLACIPAGWEILSHIFRDEEFVLHGQVSEHTRAKILRLGFALDTLPTLND